MNFPIESLFGQKGPAIFSMAKAASDFLAQRSSGQLLGLAGSTVDCLPDADHFGDSLMQAANRKSDDHFLTGKGLFFITEKKRLILDGTAGHYQMPWGYVPEAIMEAVIEGMKRGIVWDCHSDIPGNPVKALAMELVAAANGFESMDHPGLNEIADQGDTLNRVTLNPCTGSSACAAAFRMAFRYHEKNYASLGPPVFLSLANNYHGTDTFAQAMRGMWKGLFNPAAVLFVQLEPNNIEQLKEVFKKYGKRIACLFFEPVMMNNEALCITRETILAMRSLTEEADAMLVVDEIQSCFFTPGILMFRQYGIIPDAVVVGKGMTAGFHSLAATLFKKKYDLLEQFDALNTNGNAPLAAWAGLACIREIKRNRERLKRTETQFETEMQKIARDFPKLIESPMGKGFLSGLKFINRDNAIQAQKELLKRGIWVRVHAYKENHRTLLVKFALVLDEEVIEFFFGKLREVFDGFSPD